MTKDWTIFVPFNVPFNIISADMRWANRKVGQKRENPEKNHLAHAQAELGLSHMCPEPRQNELACAELCFCMAGESFQYPEIGKQS